MIKHGINQSCRSCRLNRTRVAEFKLGYHDAQSWGCWSALLQVRPALQDLMRRAVSKMKADVPQGDISDIVAYLSQELQNDAAANASPGEKSVMLWMTAQTAKTVESWMAVNKFKDLNRQAAFMASKVCVRKALSATGDDDHLPQLSLGDLCWTCADVIFERVPAAVPSYITLEPEPFTLHHHFLPGQGTRSRPARGRNTVR